jgi:hypothetical protein
MPLLRYDPSDPAITAADELKALEETVAPARGSVYERLHSIPKLLPARTRAETLERIRTTLTLVWKALNGYTSPPGEEEDAVDCVFEHLLTPEMADIAKRQMAQRVKSESRFAADEARLVYQRKATTPLAELLLMCQDKVLPGVVGSIGYLNIVFGPHTAAAASLQSQRQWRLHQLDEASKRITLLEKTCKDQDPLDERRCFPVCHICMERPRDVAFNCGHTVCKSCSSDQRMIACPVCRVAITTRIALYI